MIEEIIKYIGIALGSYVLGWLVVVVILGGYFEFTTVNNDKSMK